MSNNTRRPKHFYKLLNKHDQPVQIDLNNYKCTCVVTGARKSFYHKYLYELIVRRYNSNIDLFRTTYVSRSGASVNNQSRRAKQLQQRIDRMYDQIRTLKAKRQQLTTDHTS